MGVCGIFCLSNGVIFLEILVHLFGVHRTLNVSDLRYDHMFFTVYLSIYS